MTALDALNLAAPLADTYNSVEQRLLVAIARQLSLNDTHELNEVSKWQIKRLANLGMLRKDAARIIAAGTKGVPADFADTVQQAITSALAEDGLTDMWQNESFSESAKQSVKHYRAQAKDVYNQVNTVMKYKAESSFVNAVNSVADKWNAEMRRQQAEIADKQGFLDILNSNTADVVNGSAARTRAVRTTIHEMAQKGIPAFVDRAGREWSPEAYVNMDIRATVKNTALEAKFSVMDSLGQDVFEVSSHPGSRPKCRPWQGKLISRSGKTTEITDLHGRKHKVIPLSQTSFGEPDGLFGINCGHRPRGCTEGVFTKSAVEYDDAEDKELYNKVCRQRELERKVRKSKTEADMLEAAGDTEGAKEVRRRMAEQNKALRAYCEANGLKYRSDRVRTYGSVKPDGDKERRSAITSEMKRPTIQPEIKQSRFMPAQTIQEAEEFAGRYIETRLGDKTFKGMADFKGVSLEHANDINRALSDVFDKYDIPKISGIKAIDPNSAKGKKIFTSADAVMAYSPVEHGVYINKSVLKSPEALAAYNKQAQQAWDTVMDNIDSLTGAQRETALRYKNAGRSLVGDGSAHDYFVHEMGHHIQWEAFDAKTNNAVGSRMSQYAGRISGYATASKSEYFAESFAAFEKGELDKLDPDFVAFLRGKSLDKSAKSGIMKMGKASGSNAQMPPDFSKYNVVDDPDGVLKLKSFISTELHVSEKDIDISKLRNAEVAKPFMERLKKVQTECGLKMPRIVATDLIDGDECCIAGFKPYENTFYISSRYFNSKDALLDTLRDWAKKGFMPEQCTSIKYVAEHEAAHIRMPSDIVDSEEAMKIHRKRKLLNDNDVDVDEYFADAVAIFRTNKSPDTNVIRAIEYLRERDVIV